MNEIEKFINENFGFDGVSINEKDGDVIITFRCNPQPSNFKEFFTVTMDSNSEENARKFYDTVEEASSYMRRMCYE